MKKTQKALVVMTLIVAVMMTGATLATMQDNQNRNSNRMNSNTSGSMMMSASDTEFATMAAQGGMAEVQMAQLAQQKATSKDVQKYAKQMIKDHTKANNNLMKIAGKKQMTLPTAPNAEQMQMMQQLQAASGAEFDRMYIEMAGVQAHRTMQGLFETYINTGTDAELKSFATKTLPVVQKHLRMAQDMASGDMKGGMNHGGGNMNMSGGDSNMNGNMNSNRGNSNRRGNSNGNMNR